MKHKHVLLAVSLAVSTNLVLAAAPVIEIGSESPQSSNNAAKPSSLYDQLTRIENQLEIRNRSQIKLQQQLTELQNEIDELRGVTELHNHKISQIIERQRELYQELDRRVSEAVIPQQPRMSTNKQVVTPQVQYSTNLNENDAYDHAIKLVLRDKKYDEAIAEFKTFISQYPQSTYADKAHYWLGQLLYNKSELVDAAKHFDIVLNQFPDSNKRSDAMLKRGIVAQKQNDIKKAKVLYQNLLKDYPSSSAAQLAETRLSSL